MRPQRVLVLAHDAFWGASSVLLDECRYLVKSDFEFQFIFLRGGLFLKSFQSLGECFILKLPPKVDGIRSLADWCLNKIAGGRVRLWDPCLIYANTTETAKLLPLFGAWNIPILMHVHELNYVNEIIFAHQKKLDFIKYPAHYIAVSEAVKNHLVSAYQIDPQKIELIYEGVDTKRIDSLIQDGPKEDIRKDFEYIVGGAGVVQWRKGVDLWLQAAAEIKRLMSPKRVRFVWVGSNSELRLRHQLNHEIMTLGLQEEVLMTGFQTNPYPAYAQFDVFLMSSREDPFPLVVLENMYLKKPVVCFSKGGGAPEAVRGDAGMIIEDLSPLKMAEAAVKLLRNEETRKTMGRTGHERVVREYTITRLVKEVVSCVDRLLH